MVLDADIIPKENSVFNGEFSGFIQNSHVVVINEPLTIYTQANIQSDCAISLNPLDHENNQNLNLSDIILDNNYFHFGSLQPSSLQNGYSLHQNFQYINESQHVDDGLAVLEILCSNTSKPLHEQPEFIDISKLSEESLCENLKSVDVLNNSDDDDDVVFVGEYQYKENKSGEENNEKFEVNNQTKRNTSPKRNGIRRNPVRRVRIKSKKLSKEHILEEDFALLDSSDDENTEDEIENQLPKKKLLSQTEVIKQWPVNAHERPEYNSETNKIENFDFTIREIQKKTNKKPRLETVPVTKKSKKKYFTRKRKPRIIQPKKYAISELKLLVNSTTQMLKEFFLANKESRKLLNAETEILEKYSMEDKLLDVLKIQTILFSIINDLEEEDVLRELEKLNDNEKKE